MKKSPSLITFLILFLLSSCIYFQYINQPSIALPNEIFTVSIALTTEGGEEEPYFGVCLPIGWTIPGDSIQCIGGYNAVIYYDSLISLQQENASPAPIGYYWWAGKGVADTSAIGEVYADLHIQTDSQVGLFSIDYMLGNSHPELGVNQQRSDNHLIEITQDAIITSVVPDQGYQNFTMDLSITGFNTHFSDGLGTDNVWLSHNGDEIYANSFVVYNNTSLTANFYIPLTALPGLWNVNIETYIDSIITRVEGFEIIPPPPLIFASPDSLEIVLEPGCTGTKMLTISNTGGSDLYFNIIGSNSALQFDGIDDYLNMGDEIDLENSSFTLEAWVKRSAIGVSHGHVFLGQGIPYDDLGLHVGFRENDVFTFAFYANDLNTTTAYSDLDWHHWACTFDATTKVRKIFRDGLVVANDVASDNYRGSGTFYIGTASWFAGYFDGIIDEVRIWNTALVDTQIQQNMYRALMGTELGLISYWQFNEGIGDTTFDKTPYGHHGILQGGVTWIASSAPVLLLPDWFNLTRGSGICNPNSAIDITVTFDATELDTGNYYFNLEILSNDPFHPVVCISVHMLVLPIIPVELISFTASTSKGKVVLNWSTATEINNLGFEIERKSDNSAWGKIGFVEGHGTTTEPKEYSYLDEIGTVQTTSLVYRLKQIDYDGSYEYSDEVLIEIKATISYELAQNYPNPFNPSTTIQYSIREKSSVELILYDVLGREVDILVNEEQDGGYYKIKFNAGRLASGVYLYRIQAVPIGRQADSFVDTKKIILLK